MRACHPGTVQAFLWMNKQMLSSPDKPWPAPVLRPPTPSPNPAPTALRASPLAASSSSFSGSSSSDGGSNGNPTSSNTGSEALSQLQLDEAEELGEGATGVVLGGRCVQCVCVLCGAHTIIRRLMHAIHHMHCALSASQCMGLSRMPLCPSQLGWSPRGCEAGNQ